jgi:hypothetical protein
MKYTIESINNGWVVKWEDEALDNPDVMLPKQQGFTFNDEMLDDNAYRKAEVEAFVDLLHFINSEIGVQYSKHQKYNINIECEEI